MVYVFRQFCLKNSFSRPDSATASGFLKTILKRSSWINHERSVATQVDSKNYYMTNATPKNRKRKHTVKIMNVVKTLLKNKIFKRFEQGSLRKIRTFKKTKSGEFLLCRLLK